jgi:hypothetical protein
MLNKSGQLELVVGELQNGATLTAACKGQDRPHVNTVRLWCKSNPDTAARVLTARQLGGWHLVDHLIQDQNPPAGKLATLRYLVTRLTPNTET